MLYIILRRMLFFHFFHVIELYVWWFVWRTILTLCNIPNWYWALILRLGWCILENVLSFVLTPTKNPHLVCNIMKFTMFQMYKQVVRLLSKNKFINIHTCIVDLKIDIKIKITCHEVINLTLGATIENPPLYPTHMQKVYLDYLFSYDVYFKSIYKIYLLHWKCCDKLCYPYFWKGWW